MTSERLWITILTLTAFLAGAAGGVLFGLRIDTHDDPGPFADYQRRLVEVFELDEERSVRLRQILAAYDEEIEALKERDVNELEPELIAAGQSCRQRIRRFVIPAPLHGEFDRQPGGVALAAASPQ